MPSKKQRKRNEKLRRHEWEEVWVDDEGRELEPTEVPEVEQPRAVKTAAKSQPRPAARQQSGLRVPQPPSWQRAGMKAIYFAPVAFLISYFLQKSESRSTVAAAVQAIILMVIMIPGFYAMDNIGWRAYQKRIGAKPPTKPKPKAKS